MDNFCFDLSLWICQAVDRYSLTKVSQNFHDNWKLNTQWKVFRLTFIDINDQIQNPRWKNEKKLQMKHSFYYVLAKKELHNCLWCLHYLCLAHWIQQPVSKLQTWIVDQLEQVLPVFFVCLGFFQKQNDFFNFLL